METALGIRVDPCRLLPLLLLLYLLRMVTLGKGRVHMLLCITNNNRVQKDRQQVQQAVRKRIYLWQQSGSGGEREWSVAGQRPFNLTSLMEILVLIFKLLPNSKWVFFRQSHMNGQFAFDFIHLYTQPLLTTVVFYIFDLLMDGPCSCGF